MKITKFENISNQYRNQEVLTVQQAAQLICVSSSFILRAIHERKLPAFCVGYHYRIAKSDFFEFLKEQTEKRGVFIE